MDFSALQAYVIVCEEGKMSQAAEKLFVSKQTLSMIVKRIENEVGARLLIRSGSGIKMTQEGECFLEYAKTLLRTWDECTNAIRQIQAQHRRKLSVGFGYMSWNLWTKERHERFERENPGIELKAFGELSKDLLSKLDKGQLDAVVTCMQTNRYEQYDVQVICDMHIEVQIRSDDPLAQKEALTPWDLEGRKLIYPDSGAGFLADFCTFLERLGIRVESELQPAGNFLHQLSVVREEGAVKLTNSVYRTVTSVIDGFATRPLVYAGEIPMPCISICALMRRARQRGEATGRFIDFFRDEVLQLN